MPYIPLLKPSTEVATVPKPAMDREQRPTVNARGVMQGMAQLGQANQMPLVNPEPFVEAAGAAGAAIGGALMKTGNIISAVAAKRQDAFDDEQVQNAHADVQVELARQSAFQAQELDPSKYEADATKGWEALNKKYAGIKGLSGDGQKRLGLLLSTNTQRGMYDVQAAAAKAQNQRTASAYKANIGAALDRRDYPEAQRLAKEAEAGGYFFPHETQHIDTIASNQAKEDQLWTALQADPKNGPQFTRDPGFAKKYDLSAEQAMQWANRADAVWADHERTAVQGVLDGVAQGLIKKPEDLVAYENDISPNTKAELVAKITKAQPVNRPEDWNEGYKAIHQIDLNAPEDVRAYQVAQLEMWMDLKLDGPMKEEMKGLLKNRLADVEGIASADMKELNELAERELERGAFGNFNVPKKDDQGRPLAQVHEAKVIPETVGMWWWKRKGTPADAIDSKEKFATAATVVDEDAKARAQTLKRDAIRTVEKWRKEEEAKGKRPTREQVIQKFNEVTKGTVSATDADAFINGAGPSNALFGFGPPAEEAKKLKEKMK